MSISFGSSESSKNYLDWSQRPPILKERITSAFNSLSKKSYSGWGCYNGSSAYSIAGIAECELMKKIILQSPSSRKEFYALDIGAGDFSWGQHLADYLEAQADLPED